MIFWQQSRNIEEVEERIAHGILGTSRGFPGIIEEQTLLRCMTTPTLYRVKRKPSEGNVESVSLARTPNLYVVNIEYSLLPSSQT